MGKQRTAALWARIEAYEAGDDEALTSPEAVVTAEALRGGPGAEDDDSLAALTKYHWYRFHAGLGPEELGAAVRAGDRLRERAPDALPGALGDVLLLVDGAVAGEETTLDFDDDGEWRDGYIHLFFTLAQVWWFAHLDDGPDASGVSHDRAVAAMGFARDLMQDGDRMRPLATGLLGRYVSTRGARTGDPDDLANALALLHEALGSGVPGDEFRGSLHSFLVEALATAAVEDDTSAAGSAFARAATAALRELDPDSGDFGHIAELSRSLTARRLSVDLPADRDIDERVDHARLDVAAHPAADLERAYALFLLGSTLHARAGARLSVEDNSEAITALREMAVLVADAELPAQRALPHTLLSVLLDQRLGFTGDTDAADEAVAAARHAVQLVPPGAELRAYCLENLGSALSQRYDVSGAVTDLDEAIDALTGAVDEAGGPTGGSGGAVEARTLSVLGLSHYYRYDRTGDVADLEAGVRWTRRAVAVTTPDDPGRPDWLGNLATALLMWHRHAGAPEVLDEAVALVREAASLTPPEHGDRERSQSNLGDALLERYQHTGSPDDLREAVAAVRDAASRSVPGTPGAAKARTMLGNILLQRYELTGDPADLDEAIEVSELTDRTVGSGPVTARDLNNLGVPLLIRYDLTGSGTDLDRAITAYHEAHALAAPGSTEAIRALLNLGNALEYRYRRSGHAPDLDEAIGFLGRAADTGPAAAERPMVFINLAKALVVRYELSGAADDIDRSAAAMEQALAALPAGHARRHRYLSAFGGVLARRGAVTASLADLDGAVAHARAAVEATPESDPRRSAHFINLAGALAARSRHTGDTQDRADAERLLGTAAESAVSPAAVRVQAAREAGALALERGDAEAALVFLEQAVLLMPLLAWRGIPRADQERRLTELTGVASVAAAAAVAVGRPERAVELLEQGRSVLWSQILDTREDLTALRAVRPDLVDRLTEVRAALDVQLDHDFAGLAPAGAGDRTASARQWDRLVAEVRSLPGFEGFLKPRSFAELSVAAAEGPVVVVNLSALRCDALVIGDGRVRVVPLPGLDPERLVEHLNDVFDTFDAPPVGLAAVTRAHLTVTGLLEWLWTAVTGPVLAAVGPVRRLWWCPTGLLAFLPLHAALRPGTDESALDHVVSSYTPTLRDLITARARPEPPDPRVLVVAVPETPGAPRLAVEPETDALRGLFGSRATVVTGPRATRTSVLDELGRHSWVHFACHGHQDLADPSRNALLLADEPLTVLDLARLRPARAELAYLSACRTAAGGAALPDEAIHLASSLRLAGFRHVVATLWPIYDAVAPQVTKDVYEALAAGDGTSGTAELLHAAVRRLRSAVNRPSPAVWAPYVHIGP
ncbi:CHAT domain-containing protein [Streptomyces geranii]|uniref:CHAT domain-containing protein n=1 Tax=Streptomyces geranii TaxID=2058923 RepID=UPI000D03A4DC|nr:CHAT domain-containing protein [Streptomyces geranii]